MLFMTAVFGGLMFLSVESRRRVIAILVIGAIAMLGTSPAPAQVSAFCCRASFRPCSQPSR